MTILVAILVFIISLVLSNNLYLRKSLIQAEQSRNTFRGYYQILNLWIMNNHKGRTISNFLKSNRMQKIGIYGFGEIGERLFEELLTNRDVTIECIIDKGEFISDNYKGVSIINLDQITQFPNLDMIIITPFYAKLAISNQLFSLISKQTKTIAFDDLIFKL